MPLTSYRTGTVTVTNGSNVITGVDTLWLTNTGQGHRFKLVGASVDYEINTVNSDTSITIDRPYTGATASAQAYEIVRLWAANSLSDVSQQTGLLYQDTNTLLNQFNSFATSPSPTWNYNPPNGGAAIARATLGSLTNSVSSKANLTGGNTFSGMQRINVPADGNLNDSFFATNGVNSDFKVRITNGQTRIENGGTNAITSIFTQDTERLRFTPAGFLQVSKNGVFTTPNSLSHVFESPNDADTFVVTNQSTTFPSINIASVLPAAATSGSHFAGWNGSRYVFRVFANGSVNCDNGITIGSNAAGGGVSAGNRLRLYSSDTAVHGAFSLGSNANSLTIIDDYAGVERLRINGGGYLKVSNNGIPDPNSAQHIIENSNATETLIVRNTNQSGLGIGTLLHPSATNAHIFGLTGGTQVYRIGANGNMQNLNNSYGALSDERIKENIVPVGRVSEKFRKLKWIHYGLIGLPQYGTMLGLSAQETEKLYPSLIERTPIFEEKTEIVQKTRKVESSLIDSNGDPLLIDETYSDEVITKVPTGDEQLGIKYSVLYMLSCVAQQELMEQVDELEVTVKDQGQKLEAQDEQLKAQQSAIDALLARVQALEGFRNDC